MGAAGLKIDALTMSGEKYKPYKGVRFVTKAGRFQVCFPTGILVLTNFSAPIKFKKGPS